MTETRPRFDDWRSVGCGVESLHHLLVACGADIRLDDVLTEALSRDGYDDDLGWRHHVLVQTAARFGVGGQVRGNVAVTDLHDGLWLVSVTALEQFTSTHLVAVRAADEHDGRLRIFWPQGQLEHGERFTVPTSWLAPRMTGRGMRFDGRLDRSGTSSE